jgi:hypothetical protein
MTRTLLMTAILSLGAVGAAGAEGYHGYVAKDHVVPKHTPAGKLPAVVRWRDRQGTHHQTHLEAAHLASFLGEIRGQGGNVVDVDKASPGMRFVPAFGGDY